MRKLCIKTVDGVAIMQLLDELRVEQYIEEWKELNPGQEIDLNHSEISEAITTLLNEMEAFCIKEWQELNPGKYISHREITDADIPTDRSQRHRWCDDLPGSQIDIAPDG